MILHLHSAEYDDHRTIHVNTYWMKWWYLHEKGITHVIMGDGYPVEGFPVECVPVLETPEEIDQMWEGKAHAADSYGPIGRSSVQ